MVRQDTAMTFSWRDAKLPLAISSGSALLLFGRVGSMLIRLRGSPFVETVLATAERYRLRIVGVLGSAILLQLALPILCWGGMILRYLTVGAWVADGLQILLFGVLWIEMRKRNSLKWQAEQAVSVRVRVREIDERAVLPWAWKVLLFKRHESIMLWCLVGTGVIAVAHPFQTASSRYAREVLLTIWQVHAALLGIVIVLLAFLFQLVSVRQAYETSLLPFLAKRSRLRAVISLNLLFVVVNTICAERPTTKIWGIPTVQCAVLGLLVLVTSCLYLLNNSLELLDQDTIEADLTRLIRLEIREMLKDEQRLIAAESILSRTCSECGIGFSPLDILRQGVAIQADDTGSVADINLGKLRRFASGLQGTLSSGSSSRRALLLKGLRFPVAAGSVLGRIAQIDANDRNIALLRTAFQIEKGEL